jgi:hypothetical protein
MRLVRDALYVAASEERMHEVVKQDQRNRPKPVDKKSDVAGAVVLLVIIAVVMFIVLATLSAPH